LNVVSPVPRELWSHVVKASPEALAFHTPQWLDCICATGVYEDASLAYEMVDDRKFILPLVRRKWLPPPLTTEASPPFGWGCAGPISTEVVRREELGAILVDLARRKALRVTVRPNPLAEQPATPPTPGTILVPLRAFVLDLEGDFEHVWTKCFKPYVRTRVRKAEAADVLAESDSEGQLVSVFPAERAVNRRIGEMDVLGIHQAAFDVLHPPLLGLVRCSLHHARCEVGDQDVRVWMLFG
jgi:hypothetical protein